MYKNLGIVAILFFATSLTTGCMNMATAYVNPSTNLSTLKTMYVKHYPSDNSGVDQEIADKLRSKGVSVTTGAGNPPSNIDALVTYVDKWYWDITMYMLELTITIRDPKTEAPLATGNSLHTSLTRKSQTAMVDEVITNIYNTHKVGATSNASPDIVLQAVPPNATPQSTASSSQPNKAPDPSNPTDLSQKLQALKTLKLDEPGP